MRSNGLVPTGVALVVVAVVLGCLWRLRIRNLFDESRADALRLVERLATFWTAVTGDLDFPVWLRCRAPFRIMFRVPTRRPTVSPRLFVVVLAQRGRRLLIGRLVFARWCMRSFVPSKLGLSRLFSSRSCSTSSSSAARRVSISSLEGSEEVMRRRYGMVSCLETIPQKCICLPAASTYRANCSPLTREYRN